MFWTKVILVGLLATAAEGSCTPQTTSYPLIAGQHHNVGSVDVTPNEGCTFNIEYNTENGWCMKETHLQVNNLHEVTNKKGNPKVGHFENGDSYHPCVTSATFGSFGCGTDVPIAAHAVVDAAKITLPEPTVPVDLLPTLQSDTYWNAKITFPNGLMEDFPAYCIDLESFLTPEVEVCAFLTTDYDNLPANVQGSENMYKVNWIINNFFAGGTIDGCEGELAGIDIQAAIWKLVEPYQQSNLGDECRRDYIFNETEAVEHFVPDCYQYKAVVIVPYHDCDNPTGHKQIIFAVMLVCAIDHSCDCEETGWSKDDNSVQFSDTNGWAAYNEYTCDCDCGPRERHLRAA